MRVLHVIPSLGIASGGPSFGTVNLALGLKKANVEVLILSTDAATPARTDARRFGVTPQDLPAGAEQLDLEFCPVRRPYRWSYSPTLGEYLQRTASDFDLFHIHSLFLYPQYAAFRAASRAGVPYIVSPRGALEPFLRKRGRGRKWVADIVWQKRMLNNAAAIHLTTKLEMAQVLQLGFSPKHLVCPIPTSDAWFEPVHRKAGIEFRHRHLAGYDGEVIMYHGRVSQKKGLDILITALAQVIAARPHVMLVIIGPDDEGLGQTLKSLARQLGVESHVRFIGLLRDIELREAIMAADVWAMPSLGENFGNAVVEAMACARPIVVSQHVGLSADIEAEGAGLVVDADPQAFASAILRLLAEANERKLLADNASQLALQFGITGVGKQMKRVYEDVLGAE